MPGASAIYLEAGASELGNTQYVYNNLVWNVGDNSPIVIASDILGPNSPSNQFIYNNTLSGGTTAGCISVIPNFFAPTNLTVQNNHCISELPSSQAWCWNKAGGSFDCGLVTNLTFGNNVLMTTETAASQGYTLTNSFQPSAPNGATVGAGLNLLSNCVTIGSSLCSDRLGVVRPGGSAAWDAGAYQYQTVAGSIAPSITLQPVHQEVTAGQTATFSVIAAGTAPLNYQWQQNGTAISGATSSTYTSPATRGDDGTVFTVVVSNTVGSVTSSPALLSVSAAPGQLTPNPANGLNFGTVNIGTASTASVTLTNTSSDYITISNVSVSGPGFGASGVPSGIILAPGEAATLNVVFAPCGNGNRGGQRDHQQRRGGLSHHHTAVGYRHCAAAFGEFDVESEHFFRVRLLRVPGYEPVRAVYKIEFHTDHYDPVYRFHRRARPDLPLLGDGRGFGYAAESFLGFGDGNYSHTIEFQD